MVEKFDGLAVSSKFAICGLPIRVDTYKTCPFGCRYCFSNGRKIMEFEKHLQVINLSAVEKRLNRVLVEKNISEDNFLDNLIGGGITWHCGGMSDPFQPAEKKLGMTKKLVDITNKYGIHILFSTKSDTTYEADLRPELHTFQLSVTHLNDEKYGIEPHVPDIESRYKFFCELKDKGFKVGIRVQPFMPGITQLDLFEKFKDADHFTIEGLKIVPQNEEQKDYVFKTLGYKSSWFTQMGLLNLKPEIRLHFYKPLIDWLEKNHKSYSISDNDLRKYTNNHCCCGDILVNKATSFNTTAMITKYGEHYTLKDIGHELGRCAKCNARGLFTSNRVGYAKSVEDFYNMHFKERTSPFSPLYQHVEQPTLF